jgi:hypothetical protein
MHAELKVEVFNRRELYIKVVPADLNLPPYPFHFPTSKSENDQSVQIFKMLLSLFFTTLAVLSPALAVGKAKVTNYCANPVYLWSVGGSIGPKQTIASGGTYSETYRRDPQSGGIALKITRVNDGLFQPNVPQTIYSYTLDNDKIWYDLSAVFGDAFAGSRLEVKPSDPNCQSIIWADGRPPAGSQVKVCGSGANVTLTLCAPPPCLPNYSMCGTTGPGCCSGYCAAGRCRPTS